MIISLKRGTFKTLQYLLNVSSQDSGILLKIYMKMVEVSSLLQRGLAYVSNKNDVFSAERVVGQYAAIVMVSLFEAK